jgi:HNH endonuclease
MIDLSDWLWKQDGRQRNKHYRCHCDTCGADRGYQEKRAANRPCDNCRVKRFGKEISQVGRQASLLVTTGSKIPPERVEATASKLRGRCHSLEARTKMSVAAKARKTKPYKKSNRWRLLMSAIMTAKHPNHQLNTEEYRRENPYQVGLLRKQCFDRDNYTCLKCNLRGVTLNAHHMNSWKFFPEQRGNLDNLATLCRVCHRDFHSKYGNGVKTPNTKEQFNDFLG